MKTLIKKIVLVTFYGLLILFMSCEKNNKEIDDTLNYGSVKDIEGNTYKTIEIGDQIWMAEDLKCTKYNDGSEIHLIANNSQWENNLDGAYSWYNNEPGDSTVYGALYNWYIIDPNNGKNICPDGWHIPTDIEWTQLIAHFDPSAPVTYYIQSELSGAYLKTTGNLRDGNGLWTYPNGTVNNSSGFSAIPGGVRGANGLFAERGNISAWWSSTIKSESDALDRSLTNVNGRVFKDDAPKKVGYNLRCIRN